MSKKRKSDLRVIYGYGISKVIVGLALRLFFQRRKKAK